jgi:preprotein translocase subunit SecD
VRRGLVASVVLTCLVCFGVLGGVLAAGWSPRLGLDLDGGLSVTYAPAHKVAPGELDTVVNIITNRVNALGVAQPNIDVQGGDVVVQLPGIKDPQRALSIIGETAQLYFRPVLCYAPAYVAPAKTSPSAHAPGASGSAAGKGAASGAPAGVRSSSGGYVPPPPCTPSSLASETPLREPSVDPALASVPSTPPSEDLADRTVLLPAATPGGGRYELGPALANGSIIANAFPQLNQQDQWTVQFTLTSKGSPLFDAIANRYYQLPVAADLDGVVESAPTIQARSFGGSGQITGNFTQQQASDLALVLRYGSLPVQLNRITYTTVSPSLGKSALRAGLLAGLLGLLLVMGYTIFYYRALGVVVVLGLVTTAAFLYGLISILGQSSANLTLDLSGVTGLIVSVGITVDSYVVYFERLKDEVRAGRSVRSSVDRGFRSAYRTILSADAVSFIGALVLWLLSVGAVRGFAFFLGLSTLVDVLTAYFFTRPLVILLGRNRLFTEARGLGVARGLAAPSPEAAAS